jgi:hypothetical protein
LAGVAQEPQLTTGVALTAARTLLASRVEVWEISSRMTTVPAGSGAVGEVVPEAGDRARRKSGRFELGDRFRGAGDRKHRPIVGGLAPAATWAIAVLP